MAPEHIEAKRLLAFIEWFVPLDLNAVPEDFTPARSSPGSILKDFTVWKNK
ncbi:MAG: hypothetical protein U0V48_11335 [Anaerolineales bacterium]